eukprot:4263870-Alexandrium_andersonii.AAC.1
MLGHNTVGQNAREPKCAGPVGCNRLGSEVGTCPGWTHIHWKALDLIILAILKASLNQCCSASLNALSDYSDCELDKPTPLCDPGNSEGQKP